MNRNFSYKEYKMILDSYSGRFKKFSEVIGVSEFVILRHDVEFNVNRALQLAQLEETEGVKSTFFFQVMSNAYNPFSKINQDAIRAIEMMGHSVGLHAYISQLASPSFNVIENELKRQKDLFEVGLNIKCSSFSFHRPPNWALDIRRDEIGSMINAYGPSFFEYSAEPRSIKYVADSKHTWAYGHPLEHCDKPKIQILAHPDEWTIAGDEGVGEFFLGLKRAHNDEFTLTLGAETKHYSGSFGE